MLSPWQAIWEVFASCELCSRSASRDGLRVQASISQAKESDITDKGYSKTQKLPFKLTLRLLQYNTRVQKLARTLFALAHKSPGRLDTASRKLEEFPNLD